MKPINKIPVPFSVYSQLIDTRQDLEEVISKLKFISSIPYEEIDFDDSSANGFFLIQTHIIDSLIDIDRSLNCFEKENNPSKEDA